MSKDKRNRKQNNRNKGKLRTLWTLVLIFTVAVIFLLGWNVKLKKKHDQSYSWQVKQAEKEAEKGNREDAITYYENAILLRQKETDAHFALAQLYLDMDEPEKAEAVYKDILKNDSQNIMACRGLIDLYEAEEAYDQIQKLSEQARTAEMKLLFEPYIVPEPEFSSPGGAYDQALSLRLTVSGDFEIYYTMDGSNPEISGELYLGPIDLDQDGIYTVRAVCRNQNNLYGDPVMASYSIDIAAPDAPVMVPDSGNFASESTVYISAPANCDIYYTWDGEDPDTSSTLYTGAITIPVGNSVLSAVACNRVNGKLSSIVRGYYTYYPE